MKKFFKKLEMMNAIFFLTGVGLAIALFVYLLVM